ncbi:helix-turn-helix transcriptional regulator [Pedobacter sp. MC2016-24]|uniref:helix-turn-helix transcriptional regulator n=1 Tax=Pedobacter sp. MC2016-24 TaxID=2780090 RepID=UPI00187DE33E|nr:helix-turn-helix transcriptional regulator [Pedobacter sp. MC2016-24]MBE9602667.1 helix-turn-helix transcriptional regulator [Pedobacter sp. MC2016-24]
MENEKRFYNRIKIVLAIKRVKNKELAKYLDVTEQTISKWTTNTNQPSIQEFYKIAEFLGVSVPELLELPENNK